MLSLCKSCPRKQGCKPDCAALTELRNIYGRERTAERIDIIQRLRELLQIGDCETAPDIEEIGNQVIEAIEELHWIAHMGVKVGYVRSYEAKEAKGNMVFADCRKVSPTYAAYLPFDYIVTVYNPNVGILSENHLKIILWHEFRHMGLTDKGELTIKPHDIEDYYSIIDKYGTRWLDGEVPDITQGGELDGRS